MRGFRHVHDKAQSIIRHGKDWKLWVLCDRDPVDQWVDHRVALLGDAAHPMLQYFAQGACMAMEDAVALSFVFEKHSGDVEKALGRSEEHTSELQSLMRISYAVFCLQKKKKHSRTQITQQSITRQTLSI